MLVLHKDLRVKRSDFFSAFENSRNLIYIKKKNGRVYHHSNEDKKDPNKQTPGKYCQKTKFRIKRLRESRASNFSLKSLSEKKTKKKKQKKKKQIKNKSRKLLIMQVNH